MVTRAMQLTNHKLHPVIRETESICAFVFVNVSVVARTGASRVTLTTTGHGSGSGGIPGVSAAPPLYTGNGERLRQVCNSRPPTTRRTEPLRANKTPVPLGSTGTKSTGK